MLQHACVVAEVAAERSNRSWFRAEVGLDTGLRPLVVAVTLCVTLCLFRWLS